MHTAGHGQWDGFKIQAVVTRVGDAETAAGSVRRVGGGPGARVLGSVSHLLFILERRRGVGEERIVPSPDRQYKLTKMERRAHTKTKPLLAPSVSPLTQIPKAGGLPLRRHSEV